MGQMYSLPETDVDRGRLIKIFHRPEGLIRIVDEPKIKYTVTYGVPCEVYQGDTVVQVFTILYERDIHQHLDYEGYSYILSAENRGKYELQPDCYLPHLFLSGLSTVYHIRRTKKILKSYGHVAGAGGL